MLPDEWVRFRQAEPRCVVGKVYSDPAVLAKPKRCMRMVDRSWCG